MACLYVYLSVGLSMSGNDAISPNSATTLHNRIIYNHISSSLTGRTSDTLANSTPPLSEDFSSALSPLNCRTRIISPTHTSKERRS